LHEKESGTDLRSFGGEDKRHGLGFPERPKKLVFGWEKLSIEREKTTYRNLQGEKILKKPW